MALDVSELSCQVDVYGVACGTVKCLTYAYMLKHVVHLLVYDMPYICTSTVKATLKTMLLCIDHLICV